MKNIYMVQPCEVHGEGESMSAYLPYATGLLIAYSFKDETVKSNYKMQRFIYKKENIDEAIASFVSPAVVGFSTYIWNDEYNKEFAKKLKQQYPDCVIVFGGHNIDNNSCHQLDKYPFIDFLIHGEGEIAFCRLLKQLCTEQNYSAIPNISYRSNGGQAVKTPFEPITDLPYPSPYLDGWFDDILQNDKIIFSALMETNRGCPFRCAYCDWGSIQLKMRQFPLERVIDEMRWFAKHKIAFCFCIDSNFGLFKRDFEIVDAFLQIKSETGYPEMFKCCTTEGSGMTEFNINKKLNDCGILKGASLALQTLSDEALQNIGRKNMSLERYGSLTALYNEAGIPTYSELIYGLPGETYNSFADNLDYMLRQGTTKGGFIHYCELLMNSALGQKENIEKFKIKTAKMPYTQFHSEPEKEVLEYSYIIVSTYSMDYNMWVNTCVFGLFVQCFHYMGLMQCAAKYMHFEKGVSYREFYEKLILWAKNNPQTVLGQCYSEIVSKLGAENNGKMISRVHLNPLFGNIEYPLEEGMCLEILNNADKFFSELNSFEAELGLETELATELFKYQYNILRLPFDKNKTVSYSYDFLSYFNAINLNKHSPLQKTKTEISYINTHPSQSLEDYAVKTVWYGRKSARVMYDTGEIKNETANN